MKQFTFLLFSFLLIVNQSFGQKDKQYKVSVVGFYNFENLFDLEDDPDNWGDDEFTPKGRTQWTKKKYDIKMSNLADVISDLGTEMTPDGISILGTAEIENKAVLEDLVQQNKIKDRNYQIVHEDSPDHRGIDCALIYNPKYFTLKKQESLKVILRETNGDIATNDKGEPKGTRDILYVHGLLDGEPIHIMVNHWPSRRGGEKATQHLRNAAAMVCKEKMEAIQKEEPNAKIMVMGDLNDDPTSPSVKKVLKGKKSEDKVLEGDMFNPFYKPFKKGNGTLAYRDAWSLFDQVLITPSLLKKKENEGFFFHKIRIYNEKYLVQKNGKYKGYPFRTFSFGEFQGGYSDHFPVYSIFLKEVKK